MRGNRTGDGQTPGGPHRGRTVRVPVKAGHASLMALCGGSPAKQCGPSGSRTPRALPDIQTGTLRSEVRALVAPRGPSSPPKHETLCPKVLSSLSLPHSTPESLEPRMSPPLGAQRPRLQNLPTLGPLPQEPVKSDTPGVSRGASLPSRLC